MKKHKYKILLALITLTYFLVSIYNLGSLNAFNTYYQPEDVNEQITIELIEDTEFDAIYFVAGEGNNNINSDSLQYGVNFKITGSNDGVNYSLITTLTNADYLKMQIELTPNSNYQYIKIESLDKNVVLHEIGFKAKGQDYFVKVSSDDLNASKVIDEQSSLVINPSYLNETYFDEIYHVRNANEIANGQQMYAFVHPLFGTSIISLGIKIFGNSPFGWRIMGVIFSTLMLPLLYLIIKELFKKEKYAIIGVILLSVEFMHFTTARIATLEPFSIFFIMLMYYFMFKYYNMDIIKTKFSKQLICLGLSGASMGLACATKFTGVYAGIGLGIIFFVKLFMEYKKYQETDNSKIKKTIFHTLLACLILFVLIPLAIYILSFTFIVINKNQPFSIKGVYDQTMGMYDYHKNLDATHPFQSVWYQWIFDIKPIWYYYQNNDGIINTISAYGNPFIFIGGAISMIATAYYAISRKCKTAIVIVISYLAQLLPWIMVTRCVFIYHYYPSIPFLLLAIIYCIKKLLDKDSRYNMVVILFIILSVLAFIVLLPTISGFTTTKWYLDNVTTWLPTWYFG